MTQVKIIILVKVRSTCSKRHLVTAISHINLCMYGAKISIALVSPQNTKTNSSQLVIHYVGHAQCIAKKSKELKESQEKATWWWIQDSKAPDFNSSSESR
jgi:hypothetical protein